MREPFITNGKDVYVDPCISGDGSAPIDGAIAVPPDYGLHVNGAPVVEQSHEYVLKKKPESHAQN